MLELIFVRGSETPRFEEISCSDASLLLPKMNLGGPSPAVLKVLKNEKLNSTSMSRTGASRPWVDARSVCTEVRRQFGRKKIVPTFICSQQQPNQCNNLPRFFLPTHLWQRRSDADCDSRGSDRRFICGGWSCRPSAVWPSAHYQTAVQPSFYPKGQFFFPFLLDKQKFI